MNMKILLLALLLLFGMSLSAQNQLVTYPAPDGIQQNTDFTVKVRNPGQLWQDLPEYSIKVDEVRDTRHTVEIATMTSFDFSGEVEISVTYNKGAIREARIRPLSYGIKPEIKGRTLRFTLKKPQNLSVEVNGDILHNLQLFANPIETDKPKAGEKDVLYFGPGIHDIPGNVLKVESGKTVYLAGGAILRGQILIKNVENVRVAGRGMVDQEVKQGIRIANSRNVSIEGVFCSQCFTGGSDSVTIRNVKSISFFGWGDGMNVISSNNVLLDGVFNRNSDDCTTVYGKRLGFTGGCKNITMQNSTLWADVGHPILVGTHGNTPHPEVLENLTYRNIDILDHKEKQLDYQGCMSLNAGDNNLIRNVRFENVRVEDFREGQLVNLRVFYNTKYCTAPGRGIEDVLFKDITYNGKNAQFSIIAGYDSVRKIKNVVFENLKINGTVISDDMASKPGWFKTSDMARFFVGEHVEGLVFKKTEITKILHVAKIGLDTNEGDEKSPLLTITKAESLANPGDQIVIHKGIYREAILLQKGGTSQNAKITFSAATGEDVQIKGSERFNSWVKVGATWRAELPESYFKGSNPFTLWITKDSMAHLGNVYLNNKPLSEKHTIEEVGNTVESWSTIQENGKTILVANFGKSNPNKELTEINVRPTAFSANSLGVNYVMLDGFEISQIASPMASINGEQSGAIAVNGGTHWIIQNCSLSDCKSVAISIGQTGHAYPNANPGNPEYRDLSQDISNVGHHIIRHNHIFRCGQAGIFGLLQGTCSEISDNLIEDINANKECTMEETAGIRLVLAVDVLVQHNLIRRVNGFGLHLGPLFQGARISRNVISDTRKSCLYLYNNHGPALFDNNILSGPGKGTNEGVRMESAEANVFVQNLFYDCGFSNIKIPGRTFATSNFLAHSLVIKQTIPALPRDDRWNCNMFIKGGLDQLDADPNCVADYNVYLDSADASSWGDKQSKVLAGSAHFELTHSELSTTCTLNNPLIPKIECPKLTPSLIGFFALSKQFLEYPDGKPITIDNDFSGNTTKESLRYPGPFYQFPVVKTLFNYQR